MTRFAIHRRTVLSLTIAAMAGLPCEARAAADPAVQTPIRRLYDALLEIMKLGATTPFGQRFAKLAPVVRAVFDLNTILQVSVGPASWTSLTGDQKAALATAFQRYTIANYVSSFDSYNGQRLEVLPDTRGLPDGDQVVQSKIVPVSGDGHELDYVMRREATGWRVVDVLADGAISRVAVQRSDFRRLLRNGVTALIASLDQKTAELSGGAV